MEGEPDWISRMAEEQVIVRQSSGEEADRSSSEGAQEDEDPVSVALKHDTYVTKNTSD